MYHSILSENQRKRLDLPLWMLICFSMFNAWQMGFIYFMGPSLVLDGRTPLPIIRLRRRRRPRPSHRL